MTVCRITSDLLSNTRGCNKAPVQSSPVQTAAMYTCPSAEAEVWNPAGRTNKLRCSMESKDCGDLRRGQTSSEKGQMWGRIVPGLVNDRSLELGLGGAVCTEKWRPRPQHAPWGDTPSNEECLDTSCNYSQGRQESWLVFYKTNRGE
jgi:hypothetical protein